MTVKLSKKALKQYKALPVTLRKKVDKQFSFLLKDYRHPSLNTKKYEGVDELYQARVEKSWRFYFYIIESSYMIVSIVPHPK